MKKFSTLRVPLGWIFFIVVAFAGRIQNSWAMLLIFTGLIIRTMAAGTIKKNESLATTGIYSVVRHPLYFGSFLTSLGFALVCNSKLIWAYFLLFFPLSYIPAMILEEKYLETIFGKEFIFYKNSTPAFFPLRGFRISGKGIFSWNIVRKNREYYNWIIVVLIIAILHLKKFLYN